MRCPYCGEEMEPGVIQSPRELSWKRKKTFFDRAKFQKGAVLLSKLSFLKGSLVRAYCCRRYEKIFIDYRDGGSDLNRE